MNVVVGIEYLEYIPESELKMFYWVNNKINNENKALNEIEQ
jgi:hypothetical protein